MLLLWSFVNGIIFYFSTLIFFIACSLKDSQKFFVQSDVHIVDVEYLHGICLSTFVVNNFLELYLHLFILCMKGSRWAWIIDGVLLDFRYWLNYNTLASLKGITTLQKSLFSHTFLWDSNLRFILKEWRKFQQ